MPMEAEAIVAIPLLHLHYPRTNRRFPRIGRLCPHPIRLLVLTQSPSDGAAMIIRIAAIGLLDKGWCSPLPLIEEPLLSIPEIAHLTAYTAMFMISL